MIKREHRCFALFSGGLDSMLAVAFMQRLGYEVIPIFFQTPFFGPGKAQKAANTINTELMVVDITEDYIEMLKKPRYGFGKNMNPCIDCHGLMFRKASELMEKHKVDFLISGEVLGQRPMSQRKDAMNSVAKLSSVKDLLVRPLCQKLIADTIPVEEGWVKKEEMLDIQGRARHRQIAMAKEFGIDDYESPGGGCSLTDKNYSKRLRDLMTHDMLERSYLDFLKVGRHFRLNENLKLVVGRDNSENELMSSLTTDDIVLKTPEIPGPLGVVNFKTIPTEEEIRLAASVMLRYNTKVDGDTEVQYGKNFELVNRVTAPKMTPQEAEKYSV